MEKNKFVDELMAALDAEQKFSVAPEVIKRIEQKVQNKISKNTLLSRQNVLAIAASLLLLISANVFMINQMQHSEMQIAESYSDQYNLIPTKSIYHE